LRIVGTNFAVKDEDKDIPLNDWERTSATFRGYSTLDRGMATTTWEYDGTLNMDRGTVKMIESELLEGGSDPEKSNVVIAILELDKPRKPGEVDIIYEQELEGDILLINRG